MVERGEPVGEIYARVTIARVILAVCASLLMCLAVLAIPYLKVTFLLTTSFLVLLLGNALTPLWLFQGLQQMVLVSVVVLTSRISAAVLTVMLVKSPDDVVLALWAQAAGTALPAAFALWQATRLVPLNSWPSLAGVRTELADGWPIFQTAIFSTLLTNSGVLILGSVAGAQVAGGYAAVERIGKGVSSMLAPVTQAIYPRVSAGFARSYQEGVSVVRRFGLPLLGLSVALAILVIAIALLGGVGRLFGADYERYAGILFVLSPWMVMGVVNNLLGIQYLTNVGEQGWYAFAFTISSLLALTLFILLSVWWSYWGVAWGLVVGELTLGVLLALRIKGVRRARRQSEVEASL